MGMQERQGCTLFEPGSQVIPRSIWLFEHLPVFCCSFPSHVLQSLAAVAAAMAAPTGSRPSPLAVIIYHMTTVGATLFRSPAAMT